MSSYNFCIWHSYVTRYVPNCLFYGCIEAHAGKTLSDGVGVACSVACSVTCKCTNSLAILTYHTVATRKKASYFIPRSQGVQKNLQSCSVMREKKMVRELYFTNRIHRENIPMLFNKCLNVNNIWWICGYSAACHPSCALYQQLKILSVE